VDSESEHDENDEKKFRLLQYRLDGSRKHEYRMDGKHLAGEASAWRRDGSQFARATFGETSTIEHLGVGGTIVRATTYGPAADTEASVAEPSEDDRLIFDAIDDEDDSAVDAADALSPAGMGHAIARGWGGSGDRDAKAARAFRKLVKKVAPPSIAQVMAKLGQS